MSASAWTTVADLATALGTLILAVATFSAVRSANLTARVAQQSLLIGLRRPPGPPVIRQLPTLLKVISHCSSVTRPWSRAARVRGTHRSRVATHSKSPAQHRDF